MQMKYDGFIPRISQEKSILGSKGGSHFTKWKLQVSNHKTFIKSSEEKKK